MCLIQRMVLTVKSDNVSALTLLTKMRPPPARDDDGNRIPNATLAVVARELALRLVNLAFPPDAVHTPGVGHIIADRLSRTHAPDAPDCEPRHLHPALLHAKMDTAPTRSATWYRA